MLLLALGFWLLACHLLAWRRKKCGTQAQSSRARIVIDFFSGYFFFLDRAGRFPAGFLGAAFGATFGFSLPPIKESASAALNGYRRCESCSGTPGASSLRSTRRLAARTIVLIFLVSLFFSLAVREGSSSMDCFTSLGAS